MNTSLRALALGIVATLAFAAPAAAAVHRTDWTCWLHVDTRVACTVLDTMEVPEPARAEPLPHVPALSPQALMQAVRARPGKLAGQLVFVPLFNVPFDDSLVEQLVSSVLCGAKPNCGARYRTEMQAFIAEAPEVFADMMDPVLAGTRSE